MSDQAWAAAAVAAMLERVRKLCLLARIQEVLAAKSEQRR